MAMSSANVSAQISRVFDQIPADVRETLTDQQRDALVGVLHKAGWRRDHAVNIRLSLPLVFMRIFITIVAGAERRDVSRLATDRDGHPLRTAGNALFVVSTAVIIYAIALAGVLAYSSIIEF